MIANNIRLSPTEIRAVRRQVNAELVREAISVLALTTIPGYVLAYWGARLLGGYRHLAGLCGAGLFGVLYGGMVFLGSRRHIYDLYTDIKDGLASEIECRVSNGFPVSPRGSWPAILLGAGDQSILCFGGWWEPIRSPHIQWSGLGKEGFPSSHMRIRMLPRTGRVLAVETLGEKLPGDFEFLDDATTPLVLAGNHSGFVECRILDGPFEKWITPSDQESTTTASENAE